MLHGANSLSFYAALPSSRAQNRGFCAFLGFGTLIFGHFEHKIGVFVLFWASGPPFSGFSSTKSRFLCAFALWNPRFRAFRAQNRGFCAFLGCETHIFGVSENKIGIFVRLLWKHWPLETEKRANFLFLRAFDLLSRGYRCCGCLWQAFSPRRCYRGVAAEALLPERCYRSVAAAGALLPERYCRSVAAGVLLPEKLRLRVISPPRSLRRLLRHRFCRPAGRRRCCR